MSPEDWLELLRLERGELGEAQAAAWRARLESDPEAREWLAWAQALRAGVGGTAESGPAPDPMDVAALALGELSSREAAEVRAQLAVCPDGMGMLTAALEEVAAQGAGAGGRAAAGRGGVGERRLDLGRVGPDGGVEATGSAGRGWGRVLILAAGVLVLAWGGQSLWRGGSGGGAGEGVRAALAALAERSVLPVASLRSESGQALEQYGEGRWAAAAQGLEERVAADPSDGPAWLYLGSARMLTGEDAQALAALEQAAAHCAGSYAPEAQWLLAQARLIAGDGPGARAALLTLKGTPREVSANGLLARMPAESP